LGTRGNSCVIIAPKKKKVTVNILAIQIGIAQGKSLNIVNARLAAQTTKN
jgi:hypothetical protein